MKDLVLFVLVAASSALAVTAHLATVWGLLFRAPRWRAAAAFVLPPLSAYWAFREKMRVRFALIMVGVVVYAVARVLAAK